MVIDKIYSGEEKTIYSRANKKLVLSVECGYGFVFGGWFVEKDGEIESAPFSTESAIDYQTVANEKTIVCKFAADLLAKSHSLRKQFGKSVVFFVDFFSQFVYSHIFNSAF